MSNIILIGMMGSGKTSVGQALSQRANMPFFDTDEIIKEQEKMTIPHIFDKYGESYFRKAETKAIKTAAEQSQAIIATGGGAVLSKQNMALLSGFVVYLRCSLAQLQHRTAGDANRPLLAKLDHLLSTRAPLYESYAKQIIDTDMLNINEIAEMILDEYSAYKRAKH